MPHALKKVSHLVIMENIDKTPIAFMGIEVTNLQCYLLKNEENPTAIKFYEHMGFKTYQRKELDEQNNPYPILYMRLGIEKLKK